MTKQTIVGYYQTNQARTAFSVSEQNELIVCGQLGDFPSPPKQYESFIFVPVTFSDILDWKLNQKANFCLDKKAFEIYSKMFYKMAVAIIANNAAELEQMTDTQFITWKFNFSELTTDYQQK